MKQGNKNQKLSNAAGVGEIEDDFKRMTFRQLFFPAATMQATRQELNLQCAGKKHQPGILYPSKIYFKDDPK